MFFSRKIAARPVAILGLATDATTPMSASESLERHFAEHDEALYRFLRSSGATEALAEDLSQEAFLRLHRHLAEGRPEHNIRAWLFRVATGCGLTAGERGSAKCPLRMGRLGDLEPGAPRSLPRRRGRTDCTRTAGMDRHGHAAVVAGRAAIAPSAGGRLEVSRDRGSARHRILARCGGRALPRSRDT